MPCAARCRTARSTLGTGRELAAAVLSRRRREGVQWEALKTSPLHLLPSVAEKL